MNTGKFDPKNLKKLNNPIRLLDIPPEYVQMRLKQEKAEVMIDIGAGTGFFSIAMLKQFRSKRIYACDMSQIMLDWITENVTTYYTQILPVLSGEEDIPPDSDIADVVFMINLHHELDYPERTVKKSYRLLKPNGKIFIVDWKKKQMEGGPPEEIRCHPEQVQDQLVACGYREAETHLGLSKQFLVTGQKILPGN
ncbi:MAG: class I SAM-dependent methyltransferase [Desulfocapsaceae bacterium]